MKVGPELVAAPHLRAEGGGRRASKLAEAPEVVFWSLPGPANAVTVGEQGL